jgi:hypothetical protein
MTDPRFPTYAGTNVPTICSFLCLGLQALTVAVCYFFVASPGPDPATAEDVVKGWLAVLAALFGAFVGVCLLSAIGVAFGIAARRSGWGLLALVLNAVAFLGTTVPLLLLILTPRVQ